MMLMPFVVFILLLGFPFFVLVVANRQDGWLKIAGWILAGLFTLVLVVASIGMLATCGGRGKMLMRFKGGQGPGGCCEMMGGPGKIGCPGMMGGGNMMYRMMGKDAQGNAKWNFELDDEDAVKANPLAVDRFKMMMGNDKAMEEFMTEMRKDTKVWETFKNKVNKPTPPPTPTPTPKTPTPKVP